MMLYRKVQIASLGLIMLGLVALVPFNYFWLKNQLWLSNHTTTSVQRVKAAPAPRTTISGHPKKLKIPSLDMNLSIIDGYFNKQSRQWTLTHDKVQYATPTVRPNDKEGNTLLYGHYRREVFATLHLIKPGAKAYVLTDNGYKFKYVYESTESVAPTDVNVFGYVGKPRLTIQTCSGTWFQHRQMYYFRLDGYTKISKHTN